MRDDTSAARQAGARVPPAQMSHQEGQESDRHETMMREHHARFLWAHVTTITLGAWLMVSPGAFRYQSLALMWSDVVSGGLIVLAGGVALSPRLELARWGVCVMGIWLLFAPLVFWAPTPIEYMNDTLVGALVIALSVLVPGMPGKAHHMAMMEPGPALPPGWSYNPSSWHQRAPMIALAFVGFFISRYLAAFQLGHIPSAWDPFFGEKTAKVLTSEVSRMWPISDAGLGALAYMLEALSGFMGDQHRWRTMPWMVLMFGFLVIPLGLTHILLVISQPVVLDMWCTLCLAAAAVMLAMIPLAVDEVVAMGQFLAQARREGHELWWIFWVGGTLQDRTVDDRSPPLSPPSWRMAPATVWGVSLPLTLLLCAGLGLWLMIAPSVLATSGSLADSDHLAGALVLTVAVLALAEVIRVLRLLVTALGVWIVAAPFLLGGTGGALWNALAVGLALVVLSLPKGRIREAYGSWSRYIR